MNLRTLKFVKLSVICLGILACFSFTTQTTLAIAHDKLGLEWISEDTIKDNKGTVYKNSWRDPISDSYNKTSIEVFNNRWWTYVNTTKKTAIAVYKINPSKATVWDYKGDEWEYRCFGIACPSDYYDILNIVLNTDFDLSSLSLDSVYFADVGGNAPYEKQILFNNFNLSGKIIFSDPELLKNDNFRPVQLLADQKIKLYDSRDRWGSEHYFRMFTFENFSSNDVDNAYLHPFNLDSWIINPGGWADGWNQTLYDNAGLYPGRYKFEYHWANNGTDCETGQGDSAPLGTPTWCSMSVNGTVTFELDEEGKISIDSSDQDERKSGANGDKITNIKLDDPSTGINIYLRNEINSPLMEALATAVKWLLDTINTIVKYISGWIIDVLEKAEDISDMKEAWEIIRNVALTLLMIVIIIAAFGSTLSIPTFNAQTLIPKLVLMVILTYFSFFIAQFMIEAASVLTVEFRSLLMGLDGAKEGIIKVELDTSNINTSTVVNMIGSVIFLAVLMIGLIIALVYLFLILLVRLVAIKLLVVLAPVAFILGILPWTESLHGRWWSEFSKWVWMGPAIMGLLLIGSIIISTFNPKEFITPNEDLLDALDGILFVAVAAAVYFLAAKIPVYMGGDVMKGINEKFNMGSVGKGMGTIAAKAVRTPLKATGKTIKAGTAIARYGASHFGGRIPPEGGLDNDLKLLRGLGEGLDRGATRYVPKSSKHAATAWSKIKEDKLKGETEDLTHAWSRGKLGKSAKDTAEEGKQKTQKQEEQRLENQMKTMRTADIEAILTDASVPAARRHAALNELSGPGKRLGTGALPGTPHGLADHKQKGWWQDRINS